MSQKVRGCMVRRSRQDGLDPACLASMTYDLVSALAVGRKEGKRVGLFCLYLRPLLTLMHTTSALIAVGRKEGQTRPTQLLNYFPRASQPSVVCVCACVCAQCGGEANCADMAIMIWEAWGERRGGGGGGRERERGGGRERELRYLCVCVLDLTKSM